MGVVLLAQLACGPLYPNWEYVRIEERVPSSECVYKVQDACPRATAVEGRLNWHKKRAMTFGANTVVRTGANLAEYFVCPRRITSKGQVTIPIEIREQLGLVPESEVEFEVVGNTIQLRKVDAPKGGRGRSLVAHLRGRGSVRMSTEEILALTRGEDARKRGRGGRNAR